MLRKTRKPIQSNFGRLPEDKTGGRDDTEEQTGTGAMRFKEMKKKERQERMEARKDKRGV